MEEQREEQREEEEEEEEVDVDVKIVVTYLKDDERLLSPGFREERE